MNEFFCTTREAAEALGICVRTAQLWVEQGRLRAWKTPGGHRRILRESVDALSRSRELEDGVALGAFDVLIVDHERSPRRILQSKVAAISPEISVRTADNGATALLMIGEHQPHVLITVPVMPGLGGVHLLNALTASLRLRPVQIIVTTGLSAGEISAHGALPAGAVTFHKPIQTPLLVAMVRACYDGWSCRTPQ